MPDEEKRDENLHELDKEPATGDVNKTETNTSDTWTIKSSSDSDDSGSEEHANPFEADKSAINEQKPFEPFKNDEVKPIKSISPTHAEPRPTPNVVEDLPKPGPGLMVLQWLTYAFWGWTVLSLSGLVVTVVSQLLNQTSENYWLGGVAYLLAAVIVLFIISLITDIFYATAEKKHAKTNGTNVIMIIHAVLFALFGIGSLIVAVFGFVSLLLNDTSESTGPTTSIISGAIIFVLYGLTLLRTLRPHWIKRVPQIYWVVMTVAIVTTVTLGVVGPASQAKLQNQDNTVESGLPSLAEAINDYADNQGKLPTSLSSLDDLESDSQMLVDGKLVDYIPGKQIGSLSGDSKSGLSSGVSIIKAKPIYHYELCVDYKTKDQYGDYARNSIRDDDQYPTYVSTYGHKAGHVCYDLQTDYSYNSIIGADSDANASTNQ